MRKQGLGPGRLSPLVRGGSIARLSPGGRFCVVLRSRAACSPLACGTSWRRLVVVIRSSVRREIERLAELGTLGETTGFRPGRGLMERWRPSGSWVAGSCQHLE
jgi:hypothetical protein